MSHFVPRALGWIPDLPDSRDYTLEHPKAQRLIGSAASLLERARAQTKADLTDDMPVVDDQGVLRASTAFAVLAIVEYFEKRCRRAARPSKLFLYRMSLKLRNLEHDVGVDFRTTFKALAKFGVPPDRFWPYSERDRKSTRLNSVTSASRMPSSA